MTPALPLPVIAPGAGPDAPGVLCRAYYNEIDPLAAQVIREAIAAGAIAPGDVDERDIRDVRPADLAGYTQVHLFAGGGIWSYALRKAGWPDDRPIWTCSCPCQPFSTAGKGGGFDDERHLWPAAEWLIRQCGPVVVVGEQVADKGADPWVDLVQADLEALDYTFGIVPLASAGLGAPNIRHRSYWLAYANIARLEGHSRDGDNGDQSGWLHSQQVGQNWLGGGADGLGHANGSRWEPGLDGRAAEGHRHTVDPASSADRLADAMRAGRTERRPLAGDGQVAGRGVDGDRNPGPVNGFWRDADWLLCRDPGGPRWRPVDAGTFPLAPGHPGRVGGLHISGNAINAETATAFIEAVIGVLPQPIHNLRRDDAEPLGSSAAGVFVPFHATPSSQGGNHNHA